MKRLFRSFLTLALLLALVRILPPRADAAQGGKLIALTFDDGPGKPTEGLLDGLKERGIPATFFMLGECAANYPATVARIYREGHQAANHSWSHANMIRLSEKDVAWEFSRTNAELKKNTGKATEFLARVPYGNYNDSVRAVVGMPIIGWTIDPLDWKYRNAETVRQNIVSAAFDGAIILVHDIHPTSVEGALRAADDLTAAGYEFVTVRELFRRRGVSLLNGVVYRSAPPNGTDKGPVRPPELLESAENGKRTVTLRAEEGADIWCTLDGSDPLVYGWKYVAPFEAGAGTTVRAFAAFSLNGSRSGEISVTLSSPRAKAPVMKVEDGRMILSPSEPDTELYYTMDGGRATRKAAPYREPVRLVPGTLLRACAAAEDRTDSEETVGWYTSGGVFFRDVLPGDWYAEAVDAVSGTGWLRGTGNDCFSPAMALSRGQLVTILYRMAGEPEAAQDVAFPDMAGFDYFLPAARWAVSSGIAERGGDGRFDPAGTVTRETLAVMLVRYLAAEGAPSADGRPAAFRDGEEISPSAREAVDEVSARGILIGDPEGYFRPAAPLTRAEAAVILARMLKE